MPPETRVGIYQPRYFPQLHYFNRVLDSDTFVLLASAQYTKSLVHSSGDDRKRHPSYQSQTPIKLSSGSYLLAIPTRHDGHSAIDQTRPDYSHDWVNQHLNTLRSAYGRAPFFDQVFPEVKQLLNNRYNNLADLNIQTIIWAMARLLGIDYIPNSALDNLNNLLPPNTPVRLNKILLDAEIGVNRAEGLQKGTEWTTAICSKLGATEYFCGGTAKDSYMDIDYYLSRGIRPVVQDWHCQPYSQQFTSSNDFIANLSILDLLFNVSPSEALQIIWP